MIILTAIGVNARAQVQELEISSVYFRSKFRSFLIVICAELSVITYILGWGKIWHSRKYLLQLHPISVHILETHHVFHNDLSVLVRHTINLPIPGRACQYWSCLLC